MRKIAMHLALFGAVVSAQESHGNSESSCKPTTAERAVVDGRYVRVTKTLEFFKGGAETGELVISNTARGNAEFKLNASWQRDADDDGSSAAIGSVDDGKIIISGTSGKYVSSNREDRELGACEMSFTFESNTISVAQQSPCWWFGRHVNASGTYVKARSDEVIIVR